MSNHAFRRLIDSLKQPTQPTMSKPYWPYPLPEAEMMARYGLRPLTVTEQQHFPGLRLVLRIYKVRLAQTPAAVPLARAGWIVWLAETYPGCYLVRLPGGATLPVPHNKMTWTAAAADEPATTLAAARAMEQQRHWQTSVLPGICQSLQL